MTIVTPVLNDLEGLILCATSIGLSDGEFEHIIVDGQSSDGSFEYAQTLSDRPFTRVINQTSKYIYGAFNDGLAAASGRYVIYLHCGDELDINLVLGVVRESDDADLIACSCSQKQGAEIVHYYRSERDQISASSMSILQPSLIIKLKKYRDVGGFDVNLKVSADVDCVLKILKTSCKVRYVDDLVVHMEEFGVSGSHYLQKLKDHTIIKYRHKNIFSAIAYIPKRMVHDYIVIPAWIRFKKYFPRFIKRSSKSKTKF